MMNKTINSMNEENRKEEKERNSWQMPVIVNLNIKTRTQQLDPPSLEYS